MFDNPLFWPFICTSLLLVAVVSAVFALALRGFLDAEALRRALLNRLPRPDKDAERSYLEALEQALGKTPALLAASEAADLRLLEAFSPLTLRADQEDGHQSVYHMISTMTLLLRWMHYLQAPLLFLCPLLQLW